MNTLSLWAIYHPQLKFLNDPRLGNAEWSTEFDFVTTLYFLNFETATEFLQFGPKYIGKETQVIELKFQCINLLSNTEPTLTREEIISRSKL